MHSLSSYLWSYSAILLIYLCATNELTLPYLKLTRPRSPLHPGPGITPGLTFYGSLQGIKQMYCSSTQASCSKCGSEHKDSPVVSHQGPIFSSQWPSPHFGSIDPIRKFCITKQTFCHLSWIYCHWVASSPTNKREKNTPQYPEWPLNFPLVSFCTKNARSLEAHCFVVPKYRELFTLFKIASKPCQMNGVAIKLNGRDCHDAVVMVFHSWRTLGGRSH